MPQVLSENRNYKKALRFASAEQKSQLLQWNETIVKRLEGEKELRLCLGKTNPYLTLSFGHVVGLNTDGTVVAVGDNRNGECNVEDWTDIVAVAAGVTHTVGLRADGTVVAVGDNEYGQCNVEDWADIVSVAAGDFHTVGLRADGTVVAVGDNEYGQCDVEDWKLFHADPLEVVERRLKEAKEWREAIKRRQEENWQCKTEAERQEEKARKQIERRQRRNERAHKRHRLTLEAEQAKLQSELSNVKGLFSSAKRKRIEAQLAIIAAELNKS